MAEAIIAKIRDTTEEDLGGDLFYAFWCEAFPKGGDPEDAQLCKVLAKSSTKWGEGEEVEIQSSTDEWEGPDGETYYYCKFKKPGGDKFRNGGGKGRRNSSGGGGGGGRQTAQKDMPTITYADACAVHNTFLADAAAEAEAFIGTILSGFSDENKPSADAILNAVYDTALRVGNTRFGSYTKSYRIASAASVDNEAEAAEAADEQEEAAPKKQGGIFN